MNEQNFTKKVYEVRERRNRGFLQNLLIFAVIPATIVLVAFWQNPSAFTSNGFTPVLLLFLGGLIALVSASEVDKNAQYKETITVWEADPRKFDTPVVQIHQDKALDRVRYKGFSVSRDYIPDEILEELKRVDGDNVFEEKVGPLDMIRVKRDETFIAPLALNPTVAGFRFRTVQDSLGTQFSLESHEGREVSIGHILEWREEGGQWQKAKIGKDGWYVLPQEMLSFLLVKEQ